MNHRKKSMKNLMKQKAMKFIATAAIVVGMTLVGTAVSSEAISAATTPVKINYNGSERHNMKCEVGKTTQNNVSFTVPSSYGKIIKVKWESSNTSIFKIVDKTGTLGKSKCKLKMVTEGHAVLVLTVQTEKKTFKEKVGISSFVDIPDYKCAAIRPIHVYRGATPNDYEVQADIGFQATGKQYKVQYRCGNYFFADDVDGQKYLDGTTHGFIKIADVESIHCPKKISIDERAYFLRPNQTEELDTYFEFDPSYSSKKVTYRSLNPSIATISSNGVITAKSVGSTKIEIKSLYGSTSAYYNVHVLDAAKSDSISTDQLKILQTKSIDELKNENFGETLFGNNLMPEDSQGYEKVYDIGNNIGWCDTRDYLLESELIYSTNCFGFAINHWGSNLFDAESGSDYVEQWAKGAVSYIKSLGGTAELLQGSDNNPNYPTDDNHVLIALKTPSKPTYTHVFSDSYHFMVRKGGDWYFKAGMGARNGIFKLENNKTPEQVPWTVYQNEGTYIREFWKGYYDSRTQYILVSKMEANNR